MAPTAAGPANGTAPGLEVLESLALLAARAGLTLEGADVRVRLRRIPKPARSALGGDGDEEVTVVDRTLTCEGVPAARVRDVVPAGVDLPREAQLRARLGAGDMLLDVLRDAGVAVAYARTEIGARLLAPEDRVGRALALTAPVAALELVETVHGPDGRPVQWSAVVLPPGPLRPHVLRALPLAPPPSLPPARG